MNIILASKSPRRRELLSIITNDFAIIESNVDEILEDDLTPEEQVKELSFKKAKEIFDRSSGNRIVIGSDTVVVKDGKIYGKPENYDEAFEMLKTFQNDKHQVITGLAILVEEDGKYKEYKEYDIADVYFKKITDEEIDSWLRTGEAYDKAGAYAIQGKFMVHIDKIDGNYTTVMGLPIHKVYDILKEIL